MTITLYNVFLAKNIAKLLEYTKMLDHAIKLKEDKQIAFKLIYNLRPGELKILKIYIKINLANGFI